MSQKPARQTLPRTLAALGLSLLALLPLSSQAEDTPSVSEAPAAITAAQPAPAGSRYAERPEVQAFIDEMVKNHGFVRPALVKLFEAAFTDEAALQAIKPPSHPGARSWHAYRANFIETKRLKKGLEFREAHLDALRKAEEKYGVPRDIIVAIIGIETFYGRAMGRHQVFSALTTLAFDYPPRADLFRRELAEFLLMTRDFHLDPLDYSGSFAGALGMPQFLPSSLRRYAVDFDGDGKVDLLKNADDAIGSVASFLAAHGWEKGKTVALPARIKGLTYKEIEDGRVEPRYLPGELKEKGITTAAKVPEDEKAALIDLTTPGKATEYWLGYRNFYVITRYNRSSFYAMSVFQMAERLRKGDTKGFKPVKSKKKAAKARSGKGRRK